MGLEVGLQVLDFEKRAVLRSKVDLELGGHAIASRVLKRSAKMSPSRLMAKIVKNITIAGISAGHQTPCRSRSCPDEIIRPHVGSGASTESPKAANAPSATSSSAKPVRANDNKVGTMLGRISRNRMRLLGAPMLRAAITNSRCEYMMVLARTRRVNGGMARIDNARMIGPIDLVSAADDVLLGLSLNVTMKIASNSAGNARSMFVITSITRSAHPL